MKFIGCFFSKDKVISARLPAFDHVLRPLERQLHAFVKDLQHVDASLAAGAERGDNDPQERADQRHWYRNENDQKEPENRPQPRALTRRHSCVPLKQV